jgi:hypothetical protein
MLGQQLRARRVALRVEAGHLRLLAVGLERLVVVTAHDGVPRERGHQRPQRGRREDHVLRCPLGGEVREAFAQAGRQHLGQRAAREALRVSHQQRGARAGRREQQARDSRQAQRSRPAGRVAPAGQPDEAFPGEGGQRDRQRLEHLAREGDARTHRREHQREHADRPADQPRARHAAARHQRPRARDRQPERDREACRDRHQRRPRTARGPAPAREGRPGGERMERGQDAEADTEEDRRGRRRHGAQRRAPEREDAGAAHRHERHRRSRSRVRAHRDQERDEGGQRDADPDPAALEAAQRERAHERPQAIGGQVERRLHEAQEPERLRHPQVDRPARRGLPCQQPHPAEARCEEQERQRGEAPSRIRVDPGEERAGERDQERAQEQPGRVERDLVRHVEGSRADADREEQRMEERALVRLAGVELAEQDLAAARLVDPGEVGGRVGRIQRVDAREARAGGQLRQARQPRRVGDQQREDPDPRSARGLAPSHARFVARRRSVVNGGRFGPVRCQRRTLRTPCSDP